MAGFAAPAPPPPPSPMKKDKAKANYLNLPCPVSFEEINLEASRALNPGCFEGFKAEIYKSISPNFVTFNSFAFTSQEIPSGLPGVVKTPVSAHSFGVVYADPEAKLHLSGNTLPGGNVTGNIIKEFSDNLAFKAEFLCAHEPHMSQGKAAINYEGTDYKTALQLGTGTSVEASYIQRITPGITLGGAISWSGRERKSGTSISGRYDCDKMIYTAQLFHGQVIALDMVRKITNKVSLAADLRYNISSNQGVANVGYDFQFRESRLKGKLDSNMCAGAVLETPIMGGGLKLLLSGEIDHDRGDHRFGIGIQR